MRTNNKKSKRKKAVLRKLFYHPLAAKAFGTITHFKNTSSVALTFDDGPHPDFTPHLLDILSKFNVKATFFPVGEFALHWPELIHRMAREGHAIGNHSFTHAAFDFISVAEQRAQIKAAERVLSPFIRKIFRPPYGYQDVRTRLNLMCMGYHVVTWSVHAEDWFDHDADWMLEQLLEKTAPGRIILLHDGVFDGLNARFFDRSATITAVERFLVQTANRFRFATIPELLRTARPGRTNWYVPLTNHRLKKICNTLNRMQRPDGIPRKYARHISKSKDQALISRLQAVPLITRA